MPNSIRDIFGTTLDLSLWTFHHAKETYQYNGVVIPDLKQEVYRRFLNTEELSVGVFTYRGVYAYIAWGPLREVHCAYHAKLNEFGNIHNVIEGCPVVMPIRSEDDTVVGFTLDQKHVFGDYVKDPSQMAF